MMFELFQELLLFLYCFQMPLQNLLLHFLEIRFRFKLTVIDFGSQPTMVVSYIAPVQNVVFPLPSRRNFVRFINRHTQFKTKILFWIRNFVCCYKEQLHQSLEIVFYSFFLTHHPCLYYKKFNKIFCLLLVIIMNMDAI